MLTDCQNKENLQLMQEIEELRMWMYKKGFNSIEPAKFTANSNRLQNLIRKRNAEFKKNMKLL